MDTDKLEVLANELFIDNFKHIGREYVYPLNADSMIEELKASEGQDKGKEKELYDSLVRVAEAIEKYDGVSELIDKINFYVTKFLEEVPEVQLGLTLDRKAYMQRIKEFNEEFGDCLRIEVINNEDNGEDYVVARFAENPKELASIFVNLAKSSELNIRSYKGPLAYSVTSSRPSCHYLDLFLPSHVQKPGDGEKFDPQKHKDSPTFILPYLKPEFSIPLMKMYVAAQK